MAPVEFWFDFSSPYAYFAATEIETRLKRFGRPILWRPFLLGVAFHETGMGPATRAPIRGRYIVHDCNRIAKMLEIPFKLHDEFPFASQALARTFYWFDARNPEMAKDFAKAAFATYFGQGYDLRDPAAVLALAAQFSDGTDLLAGWLESDDAKQTLRGRTTEALDQGVFGSPFLRVDNEPFWGWDRITMVETWLEQSAMSSAIESGLAAVSE